MMRTMNDQELEAYLKEMDEFRERIKKDKKLALEFLMEAGICDSEGNLNPPYK